MLQNLRLDYGDMVEITTVAVPRGKKISIQGHSSDYAQLGADFEDTFRSHVCSYETSSSHLPCVYTE